MGIFNKIVDIFYEEAPAARPGQVASRRAPAAQSAQQVAASQPAPQQPAAGQPTHQGAAHHYKPRAHTPTDNEVYQKFSESLERAMEAANLPGFDLYEFHSLYKKFLNSGKPEDEAFNTALTSAETMRVDKNTLISNVQHYAGVLGEQKKSFEKDLANFIEQNIAGPKKESVKIDGEIEEKTRLIEQYQQDIEKLKQEKIDLGVDVERAEEQIENVNIAFQKAFDEATGDLSEIHEKLKSV